MNSDLTKSVAELQDIFVRRDLQASFDKADPAVVGELQKNLRIPPQYTEFLRSANPLDVETVTPTERVRLFPAHQLDAQQYGKSGGETLVPLAMWRKSWVIIARSTLLDAPYFLDVSKIDTRGDCPVYFASIGEGSVSPRLCASSFQQFLQILATSMEVATEFPETVQSDDDEVVFREALATRIKMIDTAALREGLWT